MRPYAFAGVIAANAAALALSMVLVNVAFEVAGSVPDVEGCGFLAGNLISLALIYPLLAGAVGARIGRSLSRKDADRDSILRSGAAATALGSILYFGAGCASVMRGPQGAIVSPNLWALAALFVLVCAWAGKVGAAFRLTGRSLFLSRRTDS